MPIPQLVALMGRGVLRSHGVPDPAEPVVTADDLGLTRGDGVFDATRLVTDPRGASRVDQLDAHLARLDRSVQGLGGAPEDLTAWEHLVGQATEAWHLPGEAVLKLMYTRGTESQSSEPVRLLTITQLTEHALHQRDGIRVVTLPRGYASDTFADAPWLLGGVKTLSYAVNQAAKREAVRRGADDVVFTSSDGFCLEGPTASLVVWDAQRQVLTTTPTGATGILDSITQKLAWQGAAVDGVACEYRLLRPDELLAADGVWLLSSVRGAAPVVAVDGTGRGNDAVMDRRIRQWIGF